MTKTQRVKIETYMSRTIKDRIEQVAKDKGITLAECMRRAVEMWLKEEGR